MHAVITKQLQNVSLMASSSTEAGRKKTKNKKQKPWKACKRIRWLSPHWTACTFPVLLLQKINAVEATGMTGQPICLTLQNMKA